MKLVVRVCACVQEIMRLAIFDPAAPASLETQSQNGCCSQGEGEDEEEEDWEKTKKKTKKLLLVNNWSLDAAGCPFKYSSLEFIFAARHEI